MPLYLRHRSDKVTDRGVLLFAGYCIMERIKPMFRDKTKKVWIGDVCIGGGEPGCHPVYDEYQDGGCGGDGGPDS